MKQNKEPRTVPVPRFFISQIRLSISDCLEFNSAGDVFQLAVAFAAGRNGCCFGICNEIHYKITFEFGFGVLRSSYPITTGLSEQFGSVAAAQGMNPSVVQIFFDRAVKSLRSATITQILLPAGRLRNSRTHSAAAVS